MTRFVVDAPTLLHLVDHGTQVHSDHRVVAPNWIRSEALQLLLDVQRGDRTDKEALAAHERVTEMKMRLLGDRVSRGAAWRIARQHPGMPLRAAEYLAITRLQADFFVTVDSDLAALAQCVVPLASVNALLGGG